MEEDSYDLAVNRDRAFTCLVHSSNKYNLSYGQVDAAIHMDESCQIAKITVTTTTIIEVEDDNLRKQLK